jgi:hypothetical protein
MSQGDARAQAHSEAKGVATSSHEPDCTKTPSRSNAKGYTRSLAEPRRQFVNVLLEGVEPFRKGLTKVLLLPLQGTEDLVLGLPKALLYITAAGQVNTERHGLLLYQLQYGR